MKKLKETVHLKRFYTILEVVLEVEKPLVFYYADSEMVTDLFTKTLPAKSFMGHVTSMGLREMPNLLLGQVGDC